MSVVVQWLLRSNLDPDGRAPREIVALRLIGTAMLVVCVLAGFAGDPSAGLSGAGLAITLLTLGFAALALELVRGGWLRSNYPLPSLIALTAFATGLVVLQPHGLWSATPYFVASVTAMLQPVRYGAVTFAASTAVLLGTAAATGSTGSALGILAGVIPWFLFMRVLRRVRDEHEVTKGLMRELEASRAAEAESAAENERARVARELHDVLAHSLSSLALQLESTRLVARRHGTAPEVVDAIGRAHGIAAGGLEEARRAIGALRGEDLPGPDRLPALVDAFRAETGVDAELVVRGAPRPLPGDARLALYRTAQEALTNVRKHARDAVRVDLRLEWDAARVRLTVRDAVRTPAAVAAGAAPGPTGARPRAQHADDPHVDDAAGPDAGGPGPAPALGDGGGYGLTGMRERAELLGGTLRAGPGDGGFCVALELPA